MGFLRLLLGFVAATTVTTAFVTPCGAQDAPTFTAAPNLSPTTPAPPLKDVGRMAAKRKLVPRATMSFSPAGLLSKVQTIGQQSPGAFSAVYIGCEMLSVPPAPLAASAGAIYGLLPGTALVLGSGCVSAALAFQIGRTVLRERFYRSGAAKTSQFRYINRAISRGGLKAILLLRLIPTPLPGINYLYGVTSVDFISFMIGTAIGYLPGSLAIVYSGVAGKALLEGKLKQPWYMYVAALAAGAFFLKTAADIATEALGEPGVED